MTDWAYEAQQIEHADKQPVTNWEQEATQIEGAPQPQEPPSSTLPSVQQSEFSPQAKTMLQRVMQKLEEQKTITGKAKSMVTGEGRKQYDVGEFGIPFELSKRQAKTALGLMTTFDERRELKIIQENYPDIKFAQDDEGNILVDASAYGGNVGYLNMPGISARDLADVGFQIAALSPASKAAGLGKTLLQRMGIMGTTAGATEVGLDITSQALGGTEEVSAANIDKVNVVLATLGGGVFEGIGGIMAKTLPTWKKGGRQITDKIRQEFKRAAVQSGKNADDVSDDVIRSFMDAADDAVSAKDVPGIRDTREFGIPYTKGQATGATKDLGLEDSMRHGAMGSRAQDTMQNFAQNVQEPAIEQGVRATQARIAGGQPSIEGQPGMGEIVREGLKTRAGTLEEAIGEAYGAVTDAKLTPKGIQGLVTRMSRISKNRSFVYGKNTTPSTMAVRSEINDYLKYVKETGDQLKPIHIKRLDNIRKKIKGYYDSALNNQDRRQVNIFKREFDNYLDRAIDKSLFEGDQEALNLLKNARNLRTEYARKFQRQDVVTRGGQKVKDQAGDIIERMIAADPTDEQVANYLFGVSKIGGKGSGTKLAQRIKEAASADSPEFQAIREAGFLKLTQPPRGAKVPSGRQFANNLDQALRDSPTLMDTLYSKEEVDLMKRLAGSIKRAQPDIQNPSRTAYKEAQLVGQYWERLAELMGFATGGSSGVIAAKGGTASARFLAGVRGAAKARKAVEGPMRPLQRLSTAGPAGAITATAGRDNHPE